ncbi:MAG TPA: phospholipid carrier-dependent glycosyltransferase [Pyrinomonadaceae bacterium]|nr:phospholipid carrier-dependent glycosyltransferase [Pyrinomonadaceae bacterium]
MRDRILISIALVLVVTAMIWADTADGLASLLLVVALSSVALAAFRGFSEERQFLTTIFLAALLVRLLFGVFIHVFEYREFFGGDAQTYDINGWILAEYFRGNHTGDEFAIQREWATKGIGWGMNYLVAGIYLVFGRNLMAAQSFCAVFGAATAPMVYYCGLKMFSNKNVAKTAAFAIAFFPSFIIWSSQLMKDGLIIFLLVLAMTMVLQLQKELSYGAVLVLILALFGILSLRFYIFYMVIVAVIGTFVVGLTTSLNSIIRRMAVLVILGLGLTYLGVIRNAGSDIERYANLERIQITRQDQAVSAESGFNEDVDVSTAEGAISAIPVGLLYLLFAPFPWEMTSFRQLITLPEVLIWWALFPVMVAGLWYAVRQRLRPSMPILVFSLMLTLAYSIFQGNVGTAYRQRTQIQVFLFLFIAVGITLYRESRENKKLFLAARRRQIDDALRARGGV